MIFTALVGHAVAAARALAAGRTAAEAARGAVCAAVARGALAAAVEGFAV
jgi:hypothetical protein